MINFYHGDCMDFMRGKPDGYYDLAVVDPPLSYKIWSACCITYCGFRKIKG